MADVNSEALSPSVLILRSSAIDFREWREENRVGVPGARFTPQFKKKRWNGYYYPGGTPTVYGGGGSEMKISRGIIHRLPKEWGVREQGALLDPDQIAALKDLLDGQDPPLRSYQKESIALGATKQWGRINLATNAGKGAIMALLSIFLKDQGKRTLILSDQIAVFEALKGELDQWGGIQPGLIESGVKEPPSDSICLAMVPTLARRLKTFDDGVDVREWKAWAGGFEAVLLDEADKATANTWKRILAHTQNSTYRLGFSGTFPDDDYNDLILDEIMGPILIRVSNKELVEREVSARPHVLLVGYDATSACRARPSGIVWRDLKGPEKRRWIFEQGINFNHERHRFVASLVRPEVPTCIIVNRVEHGHQLEELIPGSHYLHGSVSKDERRETLARFREGEIDILIVTKILDRGTNQLGRAVDLIFASGEGSNRETLQRVGRGLRRADGKEFLRLVDIVDQGHDYLHRAARKRIELYANEGFMVDVQREEEEGPEGPAANGGSADREGEDQSEDPSGSSDP